LVISNPKDSPVNEFKLTQQLIKLRVFLNAQRSKIEIKTSVTHELRDRQVFQTAFDQVEQIICYLGMNLKTRLRVIVFSVERREAT